MGLYVVFALGGGGDLEEIDDFQREVSVCMTVSRHQDSNLGPSHGVVLFGGDVGKIDDFQMGSERLHDCITANPDATENDDFQIRKQRLEGTKIFMGTM